MASLKNFLQGILDKTDLDEKVSSFIRQPRQIQPTPTQQAFRPSVGPIQAIRNIAPPVYKGSYDRNVARIRSLPSQIGMGAQGPLGNVQQNNTMTPTTPTKPVNLPDIVSNYQAPKPKYGIKEFGKGFWDAAINDPIYQFDPNRTDIGYMAGTALLNNPAMDQNITGRVTVPTRTTARATVKNAPKIIARVMKIAEELKDAEKIKNALRGDDEAIQVMENIFRDKRNVLNGWEDVAKRGRIIAETGITDDITKVDDVIKTGKKSDIITGTKPKAYVTIVDTVNNTVVKKAIPDGQLAKFEELIDIRNGKTGIAGQNIDGKVYHISTRNLDAIPDAGTAKLSEIPQSTISKFKSKLTDMGMIGPESDKGFINLGAKVEPRPNISAKTNKVITAPKGKVAVVKSTKPVIQSAPVNQGTVTSATMKNIAAEVPPVTTPQDIARFQKVAGGVDEAKSAARSTKEVVSNIKPNVSEAGLYDTTISKPYQLTRDLQRVDIVDNKGVGVGHIAYSIDGDTLKLDMINISDKTFRNKGQASKALDTIMQQTGTTKVDAMKSMTSQGRDFLSSFKPSRVAQPPLKSEAGLYDTPYFHTTSMENAKAIEQGGFTGKVGRNSVASHGDMQKGVFLYPNDKAAAETFGKNFANPKVLETRVGGKVYDANTATKYGWEDNLQTQEIASNPKILAQLKKDGYVGVTSTELGQPSTFVFEPKAISRVAQPTIGDIKISKEVQDVYNQAKRLGAKNPEKMTPYEIANLIDPNYKMSDSYDTIGQRIEFILNKSRVQPTIADATRIVPKQVASVKPNIVNKPPSTKTSPVSSTPSIPKGDNQVKDLGRIGKFIEKIQDNWKRQLELQRTKGIKIADGSNPYQAENNFHGRLAERLTDVKSQVQDVINKSEETARKLGTTKEAFQKDVDRYLIAKHAPERNARLGDGAAGMTNAEAKRVLAELGGRKEIVEAGARIRQLDNQVLDILKEGQIIDDKTYNTIRSAYKEHVSLQRIMEDTDDIADLLINKGFNVKGSGIKGAKGSKREVADVLTNTISNIQEAILRVEKNRVNLNTLNFARENNKILGVFEEIRPRFIGKNNGNPIFAKIDDPNVLHIRENGKQIYLKVKDPNLAAMYQGLNKETLPPELNFINEYTRLYSSLHTRYNPTFALSNIIRDIPEMMVYLAAQPKVGLTGAAKSVAKMPSSMSSVIDGIRGIDSEGARLYKQMKLDGGTTGGYALSTRKNVELDVNKMRNLASSDPRKAAKMFMNGIDKWNTIFEDSTRLTAYRQALDSGHTREQAAFIAKNATVNFNKKGKVGPVVNALYMFSNASIQGTAKMMGALKNPKVAAATVTAVTAPTWTANAWNDSVDPEWRDKVTSWDRQNNMIVLLPTAGENFNYVTIPVSWGLKPIKAAADIAYDAANGYSEGLVESTKKMASSIINAYNPLGGSPSLAQLVSPTITDPIVQISENKGWHGGEIRPYFMKNKPRSEQYYPNTADTTSGKIAIGATKGIADVSGGQIQISPKDVLYIYEQAIGGAGKTATQTGDSVISMLQGETPNAKDVPFVNRIIKSRTPEEIGWSTKKIQQDRAKKNAITIGGGKGGNAVVDEKELVYYDTNGGEHTLQLKPDTEGTGIGALANTDWYEKQAIKVWNAQIPTEQKEQILKKWGIDPQDARYAALAAYNEDVSAQWLLKKSPTHDQLVKNIISGRVVSIAGEQFISDGVLKDLYEQGHISQYEYKTYKAMKTDKNGKQIGKVGGGKKPKKLSLPAPKKASVVTLSSKSSSSKIPKIKVIKAPTITNGKSGNGTNTYKIATFKPKALTVKFSKKPSLTI